MPADSSHSSRLPAPAPPGAPVRRVRSKRGRYHHGDLRQALLDAAVMVLARHGAAALTLREVARRAGVTHAAPYRHFTNKDALLCTVAAEGYRRLARSMREAAAAAGGNPLDRLEATGRGYVRFALASPEHFRVMFSLARALRAQDAVLTRESDDAFRTLLDAIVACQDAGLIQPGTPARFAGVAWAAVHGTATLLLDGQLADVALLSGHPGPEASSETGSKTGPDPATGPDLPGDPDAWTDLVAGILRDGWRVRKAR